MYLDVGPYKTGTTFLQCALSRNLYEYLQRDNFLYLGTCAHECKRMKGRTSPAANPFQGNSSSSSSSSWNRSDAGAAAPPPPPPPSRPYEFCVGHSADSLVYGKNHSIIMPLRNKLQSMQHEVPRRDALIVWEYLSDLHPLRMQNLVEELRRGEWEIHIVAHYRRLYEWLPSLHAQMVKPGWNGRPHLMVWPGERVYRPLQQQNNNNMFARKPFGEPIPFFEYYPPRFNAEMEPQHAGAGPKYRAVLDEIHQTRRHPTDAAIQHWLPHASAVHVVDLHHLRSAERPGETEHGDDGAMAGGDGGGTGDPLLEEIFCRIIPNLNRTCDAIRSNRVEILDAGKNERFDKSNYDLLAVFAREQGLHPMGEFRLSRPHAWDVVQHYQEVVLNRTADDFPLACIPAGALDELRNLSMAVEARLLPGREQDHAAGFDGAVRRNKFCHVDANRTLQLPEWRAFFKAAVVVGPVVVDRQRNGEWLPSFDAARKSILEVFYPNPAGRPIKRSVKHIEFLGFINAVGTDAGRLVHAVSKSNPPMAHFLGPANINHQGGGGSHSSELGCIFGPRYEENTGRDTGVIRPSAACPKTTYVSLIAQFVKALPQLQGIGRLPTTTLDDKSTLALNPALTVQALLIPAMIVRDPLDRLLALWSTLAQPPNDTPNDAAGSLHDETFESWLEALGPDLQRRKMGPMMDQFRSIAAHPRRAISAISHDARVLVLVHECYELSLQILKERHPLLLIGESSIDETTDKASHIARGQIDNITYRGLAAKARTSFDSDYQFYDAAVAQFRKLIAVSESLDVDSVKACLDKLG
jgi:hypothetical protein